MNRNNYHFTQPSYEPYIPPVYRRHSNSSTLLYSWFDNVNETVDLSRISLAEIINSEELTAILDLINLYKRPSFM